MIRFLMITISGRRYINPIMQLHTTGIYYVDLTGIEFYQLVVDGVVGSIKTTDIVTGDALYTSYYNSLTKLLQIRANASDLANKKNFIVTHVIGVTNSTEFNFNIDPESPNTRKIIYQSRLKNTPSFGQSQENNLNGVLSLSSSVIALDNIDNYFSDFFSPDDSFKGCTVKVWKCSESVSSKTLVYIGSISRIEGDEVLNFSTEDVLNRLDKIFYSKGTYSASIASSRSGVPSNQALIPIRRIYGRNSSFKYKWKNITSEFLAKFLDATGMPEAYCVSYDPNITTGTNRFWETGILENRVGMDDPYTATLVLSYGTGAGIDGQLVELAGAPYDNVSVGDTFIGGPSKWGNVIDVDGGAIYVNSSPLVAGDVLTFSKVSALVLLKSGQEHYLRYGLDYNVITPATPDTPIKIRLNDNFEANYSIATPVDPTTDQIFYKIRGRSGQSQYSHGNNVYNLLLSEFAPSELDLTSFTDADAALDLDVCYMIPPLDGNFPTKRELLQNLVISAFGYLYLGDSFKLGYANFRIPAPTLSITDTEIKKNTTSHSIDYNDVYQSVSFTSTEFSEVSTLESDQATYLHQTNKKKDYPHYCDVVSIVKPTAHFKKIAQILTMKKIISQFGVNEYPLRIGYERIIDSTKKLGNPDAVIISLDNTDKDTTAKISQLESASGNIRLINNGYSMGNI